MTRVGYLAESEQFSGPFNMVTDSGNVLMMPPELIDAINAESKLSFIAYVESVSAAFALGILTFD
jgi:hypothetical protein